jgi:subtilisin
MRPLHRRIPLLPLALAASLAGGAASAAPRVPPALAERAAAQGAVRVLVRLDVAATPEGWLARRADREEQRRRIAQAQADLASSLTGSTYREVHRFRTLPFVALEVGPRALAALARSPRVTAVEADRLARPGLDVSVPLVEGDQAAAAGFDGAGETVVVLDTGVDAGHPNLQGKLVAEACFAAGEPSSPGGCPDGTAFDEGPGAGAPCTYSDACFHGTHVAGIAVGNGASYPGVARGAGLISIQVFSEFTDATQCAPNPAPCPLSYASDQVAALEYVYDTLRSLHPIAAVNLSLGGEAWTSQAACDSANAATKAAIDNLRAVRIVTVAAAGNEGRTNAIDEPACISSAVSVGATDDHDHIAPFSNSATFLSLWAPGVAIHAPLYFTTGFVDASGTSMSAPHVAGAFAILREVAPFASVDRILASLQKTGVAIADVSSRTSRIRIEHARLDLQSSSCGLGAELALLLPLLEGLRRRRRRPHP